MTIKEIAAKAGVSIATVSHVINHTRYVSPELVDKIEAIIEESGYSEKIKKKVRKIRSGRIFSCDLQAPCYLSFSSFFTK